MGIISAGLVFSLDFKQVCFMVIVTAHIISYKNHPVSLEGVHTKLLNDGGQEE